MFDSATNNGTTLESFRTGEYAVPPSKPLAEADSELGDWFAKREAMIEKLQERREHLLSEIEKTDSRLRILGIDVAPEEEQSSPTRKPRAAPKAKPKAKPPAAKRVAAAHRSSADVPDESLVRGMSMASPEKVADVTKRTGLSYKAAWRALQRAEKEGLVKRVGSGPNLAFIRV